MLMKSLARRISDGAMLGLIKSWLEMPVEITAKVASIAVHRIGFLEARGLDVPSKCIGFISTSILGKAAPVMHLSVEIASEYAKDPVSEMSG